MKIMRDRNCIPAAEYANQLNISLEELVGLIKTHYYYGELRNGEWFVEPNSNRPTSSIGRLFAFIGAGAFLGVASTYSYVAKRNFEPSAILVMGKWVAGLALAGIVLFVLSKLHQLTDKNQ